ncbi:MAG: cyclic beta 1-2 glucan synthetase, partial [Longimicrobiales bacterium]
IEGTDPGPAGEWLLDNYHVVKEHLREVHESLPRDYYRELPELSSGPLAGYPRVYELATTLISHSEARVGLDNVDLFVGAFQEVAPLTIGELWAIPAMLRLALLESVRRMTLRTVQRLEEVEAADRWVARIHEASANDAANLGAALRDFVANTPPLTAPFVARFLQQLRPARGTFPALVVLEAWIAEESLSAEEAAARSTQRLAITQVVMANTITSLRAIGRMDWPSCVERQSRMDAVLREDPSGFYARMTFDTRDQYRHEVERIAKRTGLAEADVARAAIGLASETEAAAAGDDRRRRHVGYFLVDAGLPELERATGFRPRFEQAVRRWILRHPDHVLVGGIVAGTVAALAAVLWLAGPDARTMWPLVLAVALIPAGQIAVSAMNQLIAAVLPPGHLPKLELRAPHGVPAEYRTAVVIPTLFGSIEAVQEALETLEARYLANREANLHFAVLSDFEDAATELCAGDDAIVAVAVEGVHALNARYAGERQDAFYLFHRPRRWNAQEGVWMGWERKRGKLGDFNRFIRGAAGDAFSVVVGQTEALRSVRYVITLDADTVLPPDAAPLLVGAIAHPLNRAVYDPARGRVVSGYGILQPRVGVSLPSAHRSRFAAIYSGHPGVDPYTTAVSDVYQDLYREGSYTGKGIYDVDA